MAQDGNGIFRQKAIDSMSTPADLTDYLKVTNPGVWAVLAAIVLLLVGLIVWACVGTLETKVAAAAVVEDRTANVAAAGDCVLAEGMTVRVGEDEFALESTYVDEFGRTVGVAKVDLADGSYDAIVVVDEAHAIDFLLQSN